VVYRYQIEKQKVNFICKNKVGRQIPNQISLSFFRFELELIEQNNGSLDELDELMHLFVADFKEQFILLDLKLR
jgi:hypothetical protein